MNDEVISCPACNGPCKFIGNDPKSKYPALAKLPVVSQRFKCEICDDEWVRNLSTEEAEAETAAA